MKTLGVVFVILVNIIYKKLESGEMLLRKKCETLKEGRRTWLLASLRGFLIASMCNSCEMAVSLMPIGDLVVIAFSSSIVFSLMLEWLILQRLLTILAAFLCILIGKGYRVLFLEIVS